MGTCATIKQQRRIEGNISITPYKVCITAFIWNKESHNLFDFENNQATKKEIEIDFSATLSIVENQIVALTENEFIKKQMQILKVDCEESHLQISGISQKSDQRLWAILCNRSEYQSISEWDLQKGDMIKLGRMKLQLIDLNCDPALEIQPENQDLDDDLQSQDFEAEQNQCRICLSKKASPTNPLFSPCKCMGSMKYIHLKCLQLWIQQQIKIKNQQNSTQYIWKRMECEVCRMSLKITYTYQGQIFCIMQITKPTVPYMTWKITSDDKGKEGIVQVMELSNRNEVKIGRVPDCDIKLKDISVSRSHAIIRINKNQDNTYRLILSDNNSKFGTLLYAQWDKLLRYDLTLNQKVLYQIGRVLLYIQMKEKGKSYNKVFTCYKHPSSLLIQNKVPINEQATINPNAEREQFSFQTHNELNTDDIVINIQK